MDTYTFLVFSFSSLFAVIDPFGCIPFFSGLTGHIDPAGRRRVLLKALLVAFFVLVVFTLLGHQLLKLFGITIDAFRIAGGILFFGIGLDMLQSKPRRWRTGIRKAFDRDQRESETEGYEDPSITPLAIPLLAGPGSITTVLVLVAESPGAWGPAPVLLAVAAILTLTGAILTGADLVLRRIGQTGLRLLEKLMGLLMTVLAVQLVLNGVTPILRDILAAG